MPLPNKWTIKLCESEKDEIVSLLKQLGYNSSSRFTDVDSPIFRDSGCIQYNVYDDKSCTHTSDLSWYNGKAAREKKLQIVSLTDLKREHYKQEEAKFLKTVNDSSGGYVCVKAGRASKDEKGWNNSWYGREMDSAAGKIFKVGKATNYGGGIPLEGKESIFPYFLLAGSSEGAFKAQEFAGIMKDFPYKVGDSVKVVRTAKPYEDGWMYNTGPMASEKTFKIERIDLDGANGVLLSDGLWAHPNCLGKVNPKPELEETKKEIKKIAEKVAAGGYSPSTDTIIDLRKQNATGLFLCLPNGSTAPITYKRADPVKEGEKRARPDGYEYIGKGRIVMASGKKKADRKEYHLWTN